jgi:hypothetical protein
MMLISIILTGIALLLLSVRIIFGKEKEFLRGHSCSSTPNKIDKNE